MSYILVTGATGFIGKHLIKKLNEKNYDVVALVRDSSNFKILEKYKLNSKIEIYDSSYESIESIFINYKITTVIHLASISTYDCSSKKIKELLAANIELGTFILEAMQKYNCYHLINTSSFWQEYSYEQRNPICLYAATKKAFENIIDFFCLNNELKVISLKLFDIYGHDDHRNKIISLLNNLKEGSVLDMSFGEQKLNMTYIDDVIDAYLISIEILKNVTKGKHLKYSLYGDENVTLKKLVNIYETISGKDIKVNWGKLSYHKNQIMDPIKENKLPGWDTKVILEDGLKKLL